jgi:hypothetical protein
MSRKWIFVFAIPVVLAALLVYPSAHRFSHPTAPNDLTEVDSEPTGQSLLSHVDTLAAPMKRRILEFSAHEGKASRAEAEQRVIGMLTDGTFVDAFNGIDLLQQFPTMQAETLKRIGDRLCRFQQNDLEFQLLRNKVRRLENIALDLTACSG